MQYTHSRNALAHTLTHTSMIRLILTLFSYYFYIEINKYITGRAAFIFSFNPLFVLHQHTRTLVHTYTPSFDSVAVATDKQC